MIYKFFKDFTDHKMKTNRAVVLSSKPLPNIFKYRYQTRKNVQLNTSKRMELQLYF